MDGKIGHRIAALALFVWPLLAQAGGSPDGDDTARIEDAWHDDDIHVLVVATGDPPMRTMLIADGEGTNFAATSNRWAVGTQVDESLPIGRDITGDGRPNLVAYDWSGGAHCCSNYYVFELGYPSRVLDVLEGGD